MKKKFIVLGATLLSALVAGLCPIIADAATTDIVKNDTFVFDANNVEQGKTYKKNATVSSLNGVSLKMGSFSGSIQGANGFTFGDYSFSKALLASSTDNTSPCYNISASNGTKVGIYYTLTSKTANNGTYYVSEDSTVEVVKKKSSIFKTSYEVQEVYTEKSDYMYYSEFTFSNQGTVGLRANNQYLWLFGLSIVTEEEISYRNEAEIAIDNLISYYSVNGTDLSNDFESLVNKANEAIKSVNHFSQVENYETYKEIVSKYEKLVADNAKALEVDELISKLGNVEYTEDYKNQLNEIEALLENVENVNFVSNYELFIEKKNSFDTLSNNAINAFVEKVNAANAVIGEADSYVLINEAEALYNELIESDMESDLVAEALNTLNEVKNSYAEMEEAVTDNTFAFSYNEDGSVYKILFIGTINNFNCVSELSKLVMYYTNESTGEEKTVDLYSVYAGVRVSGKVVKEDKTGVRYIYTKIINDNNQYSGVTFSMHYEVVYEDGHIIKSATSSIEVK